ncbi:autoinducer binding domain-containing protein [Roseivivax sediminis]|uniref:DNA-binding transcriptional regulator, CsgD family n=1 Tax=Roseivivax sediminis TaxID=936889 RepID=A0A1I1Y953_9RHOB|nr:autoinducer binding domain-containing protein [Roseivivax sediminis]SFE14410.1 DNA-binding transcriptional regulator, CsgD family [Roseivivax sediminis]
MDLRENRPNCTREAHVIDFLRRICDQHGLDDAAYAGANPISGRVHGFMTYSADWQAHYAQNQLHRIDPTLIEARRSIAPVDWSRLEPNENFDKVFRDAHDFGISNLGLTIPVRGPLGDVGSLSVTSNLPRSEWEKLRKEVIYHLQSYAVNIHDQVMRDDKLMAALTEHALSTREIEILQWIAAGKSQADIGGILSISHRTVEVHLRSARTKLNALTTAQAIGRAIARGLIYPE